MVCSLLDNTKTKTRRKVDRLTGFGKITGFQKSNTPGYDWSFRDKRMLWNDITHERLLELCPFGKVGDRLWVRETWGVVTHTFTADGDISDWIPDRPATPIEDMKYGQGYYSGHVIYAADGSFEWCDEDDDEPHSLWMPSIHMPRSASRITLEITNIRIERLQDITEEDAVAEGIDSLDGIFDDDVINFSGRTHMVIDSGITWFATLWEKLYGIGSWETNPWVWVITFKRVAK